MRLAVVLAHSLVSQFQKTPLPASSRQQYRLFRQLIAAGNEDDVLDLISSM
jgi:hypothetical protein